MPRTLMSPFLALTAILTIAPHAALADDGPTLDGTTWVLSELAESEAPLADVPVTLTFGDGRVTGSDGCNRFDGAYEATQEGLRFTPGATTMMACPDLASGQARLYRQAMRFRKALEATESATLHGKQLVLTGDGGEELARFAPQDLTLTGTRWRISGYNDGRQAVTSPLNDTVLTLDFGTDDGLAGTSGCNRYRAGYAVTGPGKIAVGPVLGTRRLCADPEGIMRQESAFTAALGRVRSYRIDGNRLEFRDAGGAIQVVATRRAPTEPEPEAAAVAKAAPAKAEKPAAKAAKPAPAQPKQDDAAVTAAKADTPEPAAKPAAPAPEAPKPSAKAAPAKAEKPAAKAAKPAPAQPKQDDAAVTAAKADTPEPAAKPAAPAPEAPKPSAKAAPAKAEALAATAEKAASAQPKIKAPVTVAKAAKTEPAAKPAPAPEAPEAAAKAAPAEAVKPAAKADKRAPAVETPTASNDKTDATAEEASPAKATPDAAAPAPRGAMSAPALARKGAASTQANGLPAAEARLARGRRAARGLPERIGTYQIGDNAATWTARMRDGNPVVVDEERTLGDYGESRVTFHFDGRDLVAYRESGFRRTASGGTEALEILCLYEDGLFVDGYKRVDGLPVALTPYEQNGPLLQAIAVRDRIAAAK